ncbi:MAG: orotate phosphoribosyltransferase, partial [Candidatus Kapaibacterium sp.]
SGKISNEYFDKYQFETDPLLLFAICEQMAELLPEDFDMLGALEMGGIPIATVLSQITGKPVCFIRKKAKDYGTAKLAEGPSIESRKLVMIEDVITSGGQVIESAAELRKKGAIITNAICVIDRESGGMEKLIEHSIELKPLFKMSYLKNA